MSLISHEFNRKPLSNFWGISLLLLLILVFQIVGNAVSNYLLAWAYQIPIVKVKQLLFEPDFTALSINLGRWSNLIQFLFYMGIPAVIFVYANQTKPLDYWGNTKREPIKILYSILLGLSALPVIAVLTKLMESIQLSGPIASTIEKLAEVRQTLFENMLDMQHLGELLVCLLILAFLPAILEEFLFRGIILKVASVQYKIKTTAVVFQALVFAILHLSFYELPGIFLMGLLFGLVAQKQHNLTYNAITHFVFNGTTVALHYYLNHVPHALGSFSTDVLLANASVAIPSSMLMGYSIYQLTRTHQIK